MRRRREAAARESADDRAAVKADERSDEPRVMPRRRRRGNVPDLAEVIDGPLDVRSVALTGLFVMATFYTLYFARSFLLPLVLALLFSFLLAPIVRRFDRFGVPTAISAAVVMVLLVAVVGYVGYRLTTPAAAWLATAPESLRRVEYKLRAFRKPVEQVTKAAEQVGNMATVEGDDKPQPVAVQTETWTGTLFTQTQGLAAGALVMLILLYFLLASGDLFLRKLVRILPTLEDKKVAVDIARQIEDQISTYLLSVALINAGLGVTVTIAMYLIGMPNPVLWGVMVGLFNFVPYVGPLTSLVVLTLVGVMTFDSLAWGLVPPGIYFCIDTVESNLITPALLGRRLSLNPVVIFVGVTFWAWLWGIGGALLAVPMLATFKILCDEIEPLAPIGEFLGP